ncbi:MAG TPA: carboxy terminal-processing peptidase, partial [Burkholderiaceae bacterium]|nr:carboxy terminal-processing peptidase [Burkholderiaceae bacterium]
PMLQMRHDMRVKNDKEFQYLEEDIAQFKAERKKNLVSLNEADRRKERDVQEARIKAHEKLTESGKSASEKLAAAKTDALRDDGLQANERNLTVQLAAEKAAKDAKDILLNEAAHVLSDEVDLLKADTRLAARVLPSSVATQTTK